MLVFEPYNSFYFYNINLFHYAGFFPSTVKIILSQQSRITIVFHRRKDPILMENVVTLRGKEDGLVSSNSECQSITSPNTRSRPVVRDTSVRHCVPGEKSIHEAIQKMDI